LWHSFAGVYYDLSDDLSFFEANYYPYLVMSESSSRLISIPLKLAFRGLNLSIRLLINVYGVGAMPVMTTRVPEELAKEIERIAEVEALDKSTTLKRLLIRAVQAWKMDYALKLYQEGKISIGKAAEMAGVSLWEIGDILVNRRIPIQMDREELEEDLRAAVAEAW